MQPDESLRAALRREAKQLEAIDTAVYAKYDRDPLEPIIGLGPREARVGIFGRDPGRQEVKWGEPFIGAGGQKVREELYRAMYGEPMPDFDASREIGRHLFWANTVPFKPQGNKAWSMVVKKRFQPLISQLLIEAWQGRDLVTLGREAFLWFAINQPREVRQDLEAFWKRDDRFSASHETLLVDGEGREATFRLHPLPHPSPLNQTWFKRFPALLASRLEALDIARQALIGAQRHAPAPQEDDG